MQPQTKNKNGSKKVTVIQPFCAGGNGRDKMNYVREDLLTENSGLSFEREGNEGNPALPQHKQQTVAKVNKNNQLFEQG